jgi:hypothetical protein
MGGIRRNDPCPCGSGKKYKHCCYQKNYVEVTPGKKTVHFTLDNGSKISKPLAQFDSIPAHNKNAITPNITPEQMMDLCLDEIDKILQTEKVGMTRDLVDKVILNMDVVPTFTYRQIAQRMLEDGRFEIAHGQICSLKGTDPAELMAERLSS